MSIDTLVIKTILIFTKKKLSASSPLEEAKKKNHYSSLVPACSCSFSWSSSALPAALPLPILLLLHGGEWRR